MIHVKWRKFIFLFFCANEILDFVKNQSKCIKFKKKIFKIVRFMLPVKWRKFSF